MSFLIALCQVIVALAILNVWLVRYNRPTTFRPEGATNLAEEFDQYGLPRWALYVVGAMKVSLAAAMLVAVWVPPLAAPAAAALALLMLCAVIAHVRVSDPWHKAMPALSLLLLCALVAAVPAI